MREQVAVAFERFNARQMRPSQVASTFVPPDQYDALATGNHALLVGPRGSGKTTLLKMLQPAALEAWRGDEAKAYRSRIDYTGVFVPTDQTWHSQVRSLQPPRATGDHDDSGLGLAAFTAHVLKALLEAMNYRVHPPYDPALTAHRRTALGRDVEANMASALAEQWSLRLDFPSLQGLILALTDRMAELRRTARRRQRAGDAGPLDPVTETQLGVDIDFLEAAGQAIKRFNMYTGERNGQWAFCFDELELAPEPVLDQLIDALRSTNQLLIFKLSLSPYTPNVDTLQDAFTAMPRQDYEPIRLTYSERHEGYRFCEQLLQGVLGQHNFQRLDSYAFLGSSAFDVSGPPARGNGEGSGAPARVDVLKGRFRQLQRIDPTFDAWLEENEVDIDSLETLPENKRAAHVGKIASLVAVRAMYRPRQRGGDVRRPSRKSVALYTGAEALFAITESNPRWFLNAVFHLLGPRYTSGERVGRPAQSRQVAATVAGFEALLSTIPCPPILGEHERPGLLGVLDRIGGYFFKRAVLDPFDDEPPGTFVIDDALDARVVESLGYAINAGAIIHVSEGDVAVAFHDPRGKRYRLAYALAPYYKLPLHLGREVNLSTILAAAGPPGQEVLFELP